MALQLLTIFYKKQSQFQRAPRSVRQSVVFSGRVFPIVSQRFLDDIDDDEEEGAPAEISQLGNPARAFPPPADMDQPKPK